MGSTEEPTLVGDASESTTGNVEKAEVTADKGKSQAVPYERFKEVNDSRKGLEEQITSLKDTLGKRDEEVSKLVDALDHREVYKQVIDKIQELHGDDRYTEIIDRLDKAVRGIDEKVEAGKTPADKAEVDATKAINKAKGELEAALADQKAELLLHRANGLLEKYLDGLPESYTADDRKVLKEAVVDRVDWEGIENNADVLEEALHTGFQATVNWYGTPRGELVAAAKKAQDQTTVSETVTPKKVTVEDMLKKDYGKVVEVKTGNKVERKPEISDDDFASDMANALRLLQER